MRFNYKFLIRILIVVTSVMLNQADTEIMCFKDEECPMTGMGPEMIYCCTDYECCDWDPTSTMTIGIGALVGITVTCIIVLSVVILVCVCCCACCTKHTRSSREFDPPITTVLTSTTNPSSQASEQVAVHSHPSETVYYKPNGYAMTMQPQACSTQPHHPQQQAQTAFSNPLTELSDVQFNDRFPQSEDEDRVHLIN